MGEAMRGTNCGFRLLTEHLSAWCCHLWGQEIWKGVHIQEYHKFSFGDMKFKSVMLLPVATLRREFGSALEVVLEIRDLGWGQSCE